MAASLLAGRQVKVVANLGHFTYSPQQGLVVLKPYDLPFIVLTTNTGRQRVTELPQGRSTTTSWQHTGGSGMAQKFGWVSDDSR